MRRVLAILGKDIVYGPKSFIFIQAVVTPIISTLLITLLFGSFFSGRPNVGFLYEGKTAIREMKQKVEFIRFSEYESLQSLQAAVLSGRLDMGLVFPAGFDRHVRQGDPTYLKSYIWGESLLRDRAIIIAGLSDLFIELAGKEVRVEVKTDTIGGVESKPLNQRFLPLLMLLAVMMSGLMIPSSTLVNEKQRRTLTALTVTPTSLTEVVAAKSLLGFFLSLFMGALILLLNGSLGGRPGPLLLTLALAAAFASALGGLAGILMDNLNSLMTLFKSLMLIMYAPGILSLFPKVPQWIAKLFPTYYLFNPIVQITQNNAEIVDVGVDLIILAALVVFMVLAVILVGRQKQLRRA